MSLEFQRVMAGEYRCRTSRGDYSIWDNGYGWTTTFAPSYGVTHKLPSRRTLREAKAAAARPCTQSWTSLGRHHEHQRRTP